MRSVRRIVAAAPDRAARYQASRDCTAQVLTTTPAAAGSDRSKNTASENTEPPGKLWVAHGRIPLSFPVHARLRSSAFILMHWAADWRSALCPAEVLEQACRGGRCWEQRKRQRCGFLKQEAPTDWRHQLLFSAQAANVRPPPISHQHALHPGIF